MSDLEMLKRVLLLILSGLLGLALYLTGSSADGSSWPLGIGSILLGIGVTLFFITDWDLLAEQNSVKRGIFALFCVVAGFILAIPVAPALIWAQLVGGFLMGMSATIVFSTEW